jgi:hypothetical protein
VRNQAADFDRSIVYDDHTQAGPWYVDETYIFTRDSLNKTATTLCRGFIDNIIYSLSEDAPKEFFVQAKTGEVIGEFRNVGNYSFSLIAKDQGGCLFLHIVLDSLPWPASS